MGKRFGRFGIFGKARPGFVGFTQSLRLVSSRIETFPAFDNRQIEVGEFRIGTRKYFSTDVGGVVEFYLSRRVMTRAWTWETQSYVTASLQCLVSRSAI